MGKLGGSESPLGHSGRPQKQQCCVPPWLQYLSDGHYPKKGPSCVTKHENESKTRWEAGGPTTDVFVSCMNNRRITERLGKPRQKQARDSDRSEREFARLEVSTRVYSKIIVFMCVLVKILPLADDALLCVAVLPCAGDRESFRGKPVTCLTKHHPADLPATHWSCCSREQRHYCPWQRWDVVSCEQTHICKSVSLLYLSKVFDLQDIY